MLNSLPVNSVMIMYDLAVWWEHTDFFQAEDGIRVLVRSRELGDVYKRQLGDHASFNFSITYRLSASSFATLLFPLRLDACLLYTSDADDDLLCVDLGGRRII